MKLESKLVMTENGEIYIEGYFITIEQLAELVRDFQVDCHDGFVSNDKSYIENWLKTGISNPKVTSLVERMMREIKRRIKRIGYRWSEKGAEKMTRLILLQLSSTKQYWETHWQEKMGINANIKLTFLGVTVDQQ